MQEFIEENLEINKTDLENDQSTMNKEELSQKAKALISQINALNTELSDLRKECNHKDRIVKQTKVGDTNPLRIVCDTCEQIVGYPTTKQIEEWKNT